MTAKTESSARSDEAEKEEEPGFSENGQKHGKDNASKLTVRLAIEYLSDQSLVSWSFNPELRTYKVIDAQLRSPL